MYRYIYVEKSMLSRIEKGFNVYWIPCLLVKFPECKPKDIFIFDCILRSYIDNPYLSILLLKKAPKNIKIVEDPPLEARRVNVEGCNSVNIVNELNEISNEIFRGEYARLYNLIDKLTEYEDIEIKMRVFLRTRRYVIPAERVREAGKRIAIESVKSALKSLCIKGIEESYRAPIAIAEPLYILFYIDSKYTSSGFIIGRKTIESNSYAKIVSKFREEIEKIFK